LEKYDQEILATSIKTVINKNSDLMTIKNHEDFSPVCPNCGITMVLRFSKAGDITSDKYYGCLNYPDCKETRFLTS
jgi:ssDNA-binding Zn-finger/Zn-ribbon topoisomerase 1